MYVAPLLEKVDRQNIYRGNGYRHIHYRILSDYQSYSDVYTLRCLTACGVMNQMKSRFGVLGLDRSPMFDVLLPG